MVALLSQVILAVVRANLIYVGLLSWFIQGKSFFLFYLLLRRLSEGLPTVLEVLRDCFFLFTEAGALQYDSQSESFMELGPFQAQAISSSGHVHRF